jgi:hypothetical protein
MMADLIDWKPPTDKGNFILDFFVCLFRVWIVCGGLFAGACLAVYLLFMAFLHLIGAVNTGWF